MKNIFYLSLLITSLFITNYCYSYTYNFTIKKDTLQIKKKEQQIENIEKKYNNKEYIKALDLALQFSRKINQTKNNTEFKYLINIILGNIFRNLNNSEQSLKHYLISLELAKKNNFYKKDQIFNNVAYNKNNSLSFILLKTGSIYHKLNKTDSAIYFYKKIINLNSINKEVLATKARAYNNISGFFLYENNLDSAKFYIEKAINIHKKLNNKTDEAAALGNLANIYLSNKEYNLAKNTYFKGLALIEKDNSAKSIKFKEDLYFNLAWTLYKMRDYKAYDYQEKSYSIKDNLRDKEIRKTIEQIYAKSKLDIEKEKTALATERRKLVEAQQDKTSLYISALAVLIIIISGSVIYNYRLRQNNLQLKLSKTKLLQQQNIEKLKSETHTKILNATIDGKEAERKEIAEILHDNVSALLSSANMHLKATKKRFGNNEAPLEIEKTQAIILEASQKVRDLSHNLVSSILLKFGLEYAMKDVAKKYSNSEISFHVNASNIMRYNQEFEIKVFNVIQELINNILKHSKAKNAYINLREKDNQLTILVKDDGVGFKASSSSLKSFGIGLNQIEARINMLNGNFSINSKENIGTTIIVEVPIEYKKEQRNSKLTSFS